MNSIRLALSSLVLTAAVGVAQPVLAADNTAMSSALAKCTSSNPAVVLNTKSQEYVISMFASPTAAGSVPTTMSPLPAAMMAMCRSDAEAQGGKPAFGGMQMSMGAMLMSLNSLDLTPAQRQKIQAMMQDGSKRDMHDVNSALTSAQQAQMAAEMRHSHDLLWSPHILR